MVIYLFLVGVQLAVGEHPCAEILLRANTKLPVLLQHLPIECIDVVELLVRRIPVPVYFILNLACRRSHRDHALNVEEFISV